ncbi:hypothetical protein Acr_24g0004960 [Actinidia rufa]|uniref:Uncharacterized protein n=1 Tax=Actinidia rufa TaxID=165716 RepID=A0A7J0GU46_9ERIC|nr:hypothetical protein Acr_24g0004960 [Actinidia rufa]
MENEDVLLLARYSWGGTLASESSSSASSFSLLRFSLSSRPSWRIFDQSDMLIGTDEEAVRRCESAALLFRAGFGRELGIGFLDSLAGNSLELHNSDSSNSNWVFDGFGGFTLSSSWK